MAIAQKVFVLEHSSLHHWKGKYQKYLVSKRVEGFVVGDEDVRTEEAVDATMAWIISFRAITKVFLSLKSLSSPSLGEMHVIALSALKKEKCRGEGDERMRR